jgi:clan AA aspartic protease (TIGR02281 family)
MRWILIYVCVCMAGVLHADVVYLKNGRTMEGIIEEETAGEIVLGFGVGRITLQKSAVARIERSTPADRLAIQEAWEEKYLTHQKYVPEPYRELAEDFNNLVRQRAGASSALERIQELKEEMTRLQQRRVRTEQHWVRAARAFKDIRLKDKPRAYNAAVAKNNRLSAQLIELNDQIAEKLEAAQQERKTIHDYLVRLRSFQERFNTLRDSGEPLEHDQEPPLLQRMERQLEKYRGETHSADIPYRRVRGQIVVEARLNDAVDVRLLVDTGATSVSFSDALAREMGLHLPVDRSVDVTLADGTRTQARPVVLNAVQVGEMRVEQVPAVVLENVPDDGLDGLLGMSFLREFSIQLDPLRGELVLKQFRP